MPQLSLAVQLAALQPTDLPDGPSLLPCRGQGVDVLATQRAGGHAEEAGRQEHPHQQNQGQPQQDSGDHRVPTGPAVKNTGAEGALLCSGLLLAR